MKAFLSLLITGLFGWAIWWLYLSPDAVRERAVDKVISEMRYAVQSRDRMKVKSFVERFLLSDGKLSLEVKTYASEPFDAQPVMKEVFAREVLAEFFDHLLYSMTTFKGTIELVEYIPGKTLETAKLKLHIAADADGPMYVRRDRVDTDFSTDSTCVLIVQFVGEEGYYSPKLKDGSCTTALNIAPKGGYSKVNHLKDKIRDNL